MIGALMDNYSKYYRSNVDLQVNDVMLDFGIKLIDIRGGLDKISGSGD